MKRFQGCLQALTDAKLDVKANHIWDMSPTLHKDPVKVMRAWVREGDLPGAIFVFSDDIALYVMDVLKDAGYKIPEDLYWMWQYVGVGTNDPSSYHDRSTHIRNGDPECGNVTALSQ